MESLFVKNLLQWGKGVKRDLPWKSTNDPYKIWLSEIILQQTRVAQGRPYYLKFVENYPSVYDFANASEDDILALWKGLGYYSRARSMHLTAKMIVSNFNGEFPKKYEDMIQLKGVGTYTAAAILSFAFNAPHAVVDGNVIRVLTRYFGILEAIDNAKMKNKIQKLADDLLPNNKASVYNQAIMDFGATFCTPKKPDCINCPMNTKCIAFKDDLVGQIPLKVKKIKKKERYFHFLYFEKNREILMYKRNEKDIWKGLFQLPIIEVFNKPDSLIDISFLKDSNFEKIKTLTFIEHKTQILTHQKINGYFWMIKSDELLINKNLSSHYSWIKINDLDKIGLPRIIDLFLSKYLLSLK